MCRSLAACLGLVGGSGAAVGPHSARTDHDPPSTEIRPFPCAAPRSHCAGRRPHPRAPGRRAVTAPTVASRLHVPESLADALAVLAAEGGAAAPLAGGTWVMRSPVRGEALRPTYVALSGLPELTAVHVGADFFSVGGCVTHAQIAAAAAGAADLHALAQAAARSANP